MNKTILTSLMKLFALIANQKETLEKAFDRVHVRSFLKSQFGAGVVDEYIELYESFKLEFAVRQVKGKVSSSLILLQISKETNSELSKKQKYYLLLSLINFTKYSDSNINEASNESLQTFIETFVEAINVEENAYHEIKHFVEQNIRLIPSKSKLLIISGRKSLLKSKIKRIVVNGFNGVVTLYFLEEASLFLISFNGKCLLELNRRSLLQNHAYLLSNEATLFEENLGSLTYNDIVKELTVDSNTPELVLEARNLTYHFEGTNIGVQDLSFTIESCQLMGILGGSGSGKTTLINLLNGTIKPNDGDVFINGKAIDSSTLSSLIGNVPQDDLLIDELTVYDNFYFYGKLCLGNISSKELHERIEGILHVLGLFEKRDLKVGSPLKKTISGGQRKRVNIGLELLKDPKIIYLDEPTSGLSSSDTMHLISLLKTLSLQGKIIVLNIHQPAFEVFRIFDKVMFLDIGGYPVYYGLPMDSYEYFAQITNRVIDNNQATGQLEYFDPGSILSMLDEKKVDVLGQYTKERKIDPIEWNEHYKKEQQKLGEKKTELEVYSDENKHENNLPPKLIQMWFYFRRTLKTRYNDTQYKWINLLISPVLAFVLAIFSKQFVFNENQELVYSFFNNYNVPVFIFMCVIVVLFLGLMLSAEEIIGDRSLLKREALNGLSHLSYLNSKMIYLFIVSAIQVFLFVLISLFILEMESFIFKFLIHLMLLSLFANLLGLYVSALLKSKAAIYITIPIILIPQILLSGAVLDYDKVNPKISSQVYTPIFGDIMASRWTFETLVVDQFANNKYEKSFYDYDEGLSNNSIVRNYIIPKIKDELRRNKISPLVKNEIEKLVYRYPVVQNPFKIPNYNQITIGNYLYTLKKYLNEQNADLGELKEKHIKTIIDNKGKQYLIDLKRNFANDQIIRRVQNSTNLDRIRVYENNLILNYHQVFRITDSALGRSHLYAYKKRIGNLLITTPVFNSFIVFLMCLIIYMLLYKTIKKQF